MNSLRYQSGEDIRTGDRILFHGNAAEVEFVASDPADPEIDWYVKEYGGGIMILDPQLSGRTFIPAEQIKDYEDLEFVARGE